MLPVLGLCATMDVSTRSTIARESVSLRRTDRALAGAPHRHYPLFPRVLRRLVQTTTMCCAGNHTTGSVFPRQSVITALAPLIPRPRTVATDPEVCVRVGCRPWLHACHQPRYKATHA